MRLQRIQELRFIRILKVKTVLPLTVVPGPWQVNGKLKQQTKWERLQANAKLKSTVSLTLHYLRCMFISSYVIPLRKLHKYVCFYFEVTIFVNEMHFEK